ncbi:ABC transporter permease subunit [Nesterenkonia xinjiangensis]|uniref:Multiple sugar transport system permease protein n=1 Tax=Nesterenkonia xinjiangensis TaxID=225327 RepID=A0A7Z0GJ64_9MICC|nr:multiple sugar transport system permease protein [Nesterenkonia xinjiangensis]
MTTAPLTTPRSRRGFQNSRRHLVFLIPAAAFMAAFAVYPLLQLAWMSVHDVTQATLNVPGWEFVGLENFIRGFTAGESAAAVNRTLVVVAVVTTAGMLLGFVAAIAMRTSGWWSAALLALMVFVWALPPVVNGSVWKFLLAERGLFNTVLGALGLDTLPFLYDPQWALISVASVAAFAVIPFNALVFRAALMAIPPEVFEAAAVDGASKFQEIRFIMVPAVRGTTLVLFVLTVVYGFRSFDYIYVMTFGGPGTATATLPFLGYLQAFNRYDYGLGSATSFLAVVGVLALAGAYAWTIRREERT